MNFRASKADSVFGGHFTLTDDKVWFHHLAGANIFLSLFCCLSVCAFSTNDAMLSYICLSTKAFPFGSFLHQLVAGRSCCFVPWNASYCVKNPLKVLYWLVSICCLLGDVYKK